MESNLISNEIRSIVSRIGSAYEKIDWKPCPICKEDWNRLQPLIFFRKDGNGNMQKNLTYSCPPCSKSVLSAKWVEANYGIPFDSTAEIKRHPTFYGIPNDDVPPSAYFVKFIDGTVLATRGDRVVIYRPSKEPTSFDNIVQAMIFLSEGEIQKEETQDWTR